MSITDANPGVACDAALAPIAVSDACPANDDGVHRCRLNPDGHAHPLLHHCRCGTFLSLPPHHPTGGRPAEHEGGRPVG